MRTPCGSYSGGKATPLCSSVSHFLGPSLPLPAPLAPLPECRRLAVATAAPSSSSRPRFRRAVAAQHDLSATAPELSGGQPAADTSCRQVCSCCIPAGPCQGSSTPCQWHRQLRGSPQNCEVGHLSPPALPLLKCGGPAGFCQQPRGSPHQHMQMPAGGCLGPAAAHSPGGSAGPVHSCWLPGWQGHWCRSAGRQWARTLVCAGAPLGCGLVGPRGGPLLACAGRQPARCQGLVVLRVAAGRGLRDLAILGLVCAGEDHQGLSLACGRCPGGRGMPGVCRLRPQATSGGGVWHFWVGRSCLPPAEGRPSWQGAAGSLTEIA